MKVLKFLGSAAYSMVMFYLLWLLFFWIVPVVISLSWGWLVVVVIFGGGILAGIVTGGASLLVLPVVWLSSDCRAAKYPPLLFGLYYGYDAVKMPWIVNVDYGVLQHIWGILLVISILGLFVSLMVAPLYVKVNEDGE